MLATKTTSFGTTYYEYQFTNADKVVIALSYPRIGAWKFEGQFIQYKVSTSTNRQPIPVGSIDQLTEPARERAPLFLLPLRVWPRKTHRLALKLSRAHQVLPELTLTFMAVGWRIL